MTVRATTNVTKVTAVTRRCSYKECNNVVNNSSLKINLSMLRLHHGICVTQQRSVTAVTMLQLLDIAVTIQLLQRSMF